MLPGMYLPRGGGRGPRTLSFVQGFLSNTNGASFSVSDAAIGTPASDRVLLIVTHAQGSNASTSSSLTVGGVGATLLAEMFESNTNTHISMFAIAVPSGANANIVASWSASKQRHAITVFASYGLPSLTPVGLDAQTIASGSPLTMNVNTERDGFVLASVINGNSNTGTAVWASPFDGVDLEAIVNSRRISTSFINNTNGDPVSPSVAFGQTGSPKSGIAVSF